MPLVSRLLCLFGHHRRSRGRARRVTGGFRSRCRDCGVPMEKLDGDVWRVTDVKVSPATQDS